MKKYFLLLLLLILTLSCSKKTEVKGKITNASPLERIEIIEATGVGTLPIVNLGLNNKGEFSGSFDAPKDGMYALTYGGQMNMIYLKKGQTLDISGNGATFPQQMVISGDAKPNNDFIKETQKYFETYASKINVGDMVSKDEKQFITDFKKIQSDLLKELEDAAKKHGADDSALNFKKDETNARLLGLIEAYEQSTAQSTGKPFKASKAFENLKNSMLADHDRMIKEVPAYRDYTLNKMNSEFQQFAQTRRPGPDTMLSDVFAKFLATKKDMSQITKDYLFAYVLAQTDINFNNVKKYDQITKLIDANIKDATVKDDLKKLQNVLMGAKTGTTPELTLINKEGKTIQISDLKGKPTLVTFYTSWNPNISVMTVPVLKEVVNFYKSKMNFAYINLDDTKDQFAKTSAAMFKGFPGENYWVEGGINAEPVKKFGIYGFKTPSYIILDKDGNVASRPFFNLGDPELVEALNKATGLQAPQVQSQLPPQMMPPVQEAPAAGK